MGAPWEPDRTLTIEDEHGVLEVGTKVHRHFGAGMDLHVGTHQLREVAAGRSDAA